MRISGVLLDETIKKVKEPLGKYVKFYTDVDIINCLDGKN